MHDHGHETLYIDSDIHESWVMGIGPWATLCDIMNVLNLGNLFLLLLFNDLHASNFQVSLYHVKENKIHLPLYCDYSR